jgi:hypothetical protein
VKRPGFPGKPRARKPLARKAPDRKAAAAPARKLPDRKAEASRAALSALKRARRAADKAGVELSGWEGEFLGSVADRLKTYGRAFADPDKGAAGAALSARQGVKLKEIAAKASGKPRAPPFKRRRVALGKSEDTD